MNRLELTSEQYRKLAHRAADLTADFLQELPTMRSFPETTGEESRSAFDGPLPAKGLGELVIDDLTKVLELSRPPSPRFFGYVFGSGEPVAAVGDLVASVVNQNVTSWRSGPS